MSGLFDDEEDEEEQDDIIGVGGSSKPNTRETSVQNAPPKVTDKNTLVEPVEDIDRVVELYTNFDDIKNRLLTGADTTEISNNIHVNKSGWRKIATAFNLSSETISITTWVEDGVVKARVMSRVTAPNGKVSTKSGMCASNESNHMERLEGSIKQNHDTKGWSPADPDVVNVDGKWRRIKEPKAVNEHNIVATAETRATNRAISDLVGGGEVSAEEIGKEDVFN